jgi:pimeloyl-ACP methyl ester carboxylesterase
LSAGYRPVRARREETLTIRGLGYCLHCWGPADAEPVLLLHGWGDSGATFQFLVDALGGEQRFVAPDWRGFGNTAWSPAGYWFPDYLADLDAIVDALGAADLCILGQSMGGNVAGLYAGVRPERVRALVLVEGFGLPDSNPAEAPARYRRWLDEQHHAAEFRRYPSVDALAERLRERNPALGAARARFMAEAWSRPHEGGCVLRADPAHKRVNPVSYRRAEAEACWRAITAPVLLVAGSASRFQRLLDDVWLARAASGAFPVAEREIIADAGHMVHHEQPERLAAVVEAFFAAQGGA